MGCTKLAKIDAHGKINDRLMSQCILLHSNHGSFSFKISFKKFSVNKKIMLNIFSDCRSNNPGGMCDNKHSNPLCIHIPLNRQGAQTYGSPRDEKQGA